MTVRPEIASGASGRQYRPAFVASVLLVGAGLVAVMSVVIVRTGGPTVILGAIAPVVIALCVCALFWLVATPYAIQWDEKALDLAFAFRRDIVEWGDVESYRKFNRGGWGGGGGAHLEGETVGIGVFLKYRPSGQTGRRLRWAVVSVPGFVAAESFGLFGPPLLPGKYTTPFDVYVPDKDWA